MELATGKGEGVERAEGGGGGGFLVGVGVGSGEVVPGTSAVVFEVGERSPFAEVGGDLEEEFVGEREEIGAGAGWYWRWRG